MNRIVNYLLEHVFRTDTKRMPLPLPSGLRKQWRSHAKNPVKQLPWIPSFFFSFFLFLDQIVVVEFSGRRSSSRIDPWFQYSDQEWVRKVQESLQERCDWSCDPVIDPFLRVQWHCLWNAVDSESLTGSWWLTKQGSTRLGRKWMKWNAMTWMDEWTEMTSGSEWIGFDWFVAGAVPAAAAGREGA